MDNLGCGYDADAKTDESKYDAMESCLECSSDVLEAGSS